MKIGLHSESPSRRTLFAWAVALLLAIGAITAISVQFTHKNPVVKTSTKPIYDKSVNRVFIKDFNQYGNYFPADKRQAIENTLYYYVSHDTPDLYTGVIRPNSLSQTKNSDGTLETAILVDIMPANVTYILGSSGRDKYGVFASRIQCAPKEQQKYPSAMCEDGMQHRDG